MATFFTAASARQGFTGSRRRVLRNKKRRLPSFFALATLEGVMRAIPSWVDLGWVRAPASSQPSFTFDEFFVCLKSDYSHYTPVHGTPDFWRVRNNYRSCLYTEHATYRLSKFPCRCSWSVKYKSDCPPRRNNYEFLSPPRQLRRVM